MRLIQEDYLEDPWRVLVCCILLNRTQGVQARPVLEKLFRLWPKASDLAGASLTDVEFVIAPLGLVKRASYLILMSLQYDAAKPTVSVTHLCGCGTYAQEAWNMLILGRRDFTPRDVKLRQRMEELRDV